MLLALAPSMYYVPLALISICLSTGLKTTLSTACKNTIPSIIQLEFIWTPSTFSSELPQFLLDKRENNQNFLFAKHTIYNLDSEIRIRLASQKPNLFSLFSLIPKYHTLFLSGLYSVYLLEYFENLYTWLNKWLKGTTAVSTIQFFKWLKLYCG